jgi:hypothetical protein
MVGTIDQFRANLIGGGARANQFKVEITNPPGIAAGLPTENAAFLCKTTNLPSMAIGEIPLPFRGRQVYIAGDREFPDAWTTTFLNDTNFAIRNAMERWQNGINDLVTGTGSVVSSDYQADLRVSQLDRDDQVLKVYLFRNAWPLTVSQIDLATDSTNAIEEFEVTWRYQHFESSEVTPGLAALAG